MVERWRRELGRLEGLEPPTGVVEAAGNRPRPPSAGPGTRSRIAAALVAFTVFATAGTWAWRAFGTGDKVDRPSPGHVLTYPPAPTSGYYFLFPEESPVATNDPNGGVKLVVLTNLPDGTMISIEHKTLAPDPSHDPESSGSTCCPKVKDGEIVVGVNDQSCYNQVGSTGNSWGFDVTLTAAPNPRSMMLGGGIGSEGVAAGSGEPPRQPQNVLDVLGPHFEELTGDQVVPAGKDLTLVGSLHRPWPADSCVGTRAGFIPDDCPASQTQIQGDRLEGAMGEVMGQIGQARLCEMWQASLTPDAEAAHPWAEFRAEWERWLYDPPKDFTPGGSGVDSDLTWHVVSQDGDRSTIDLVLAGERVAQLVVASLPDWPGADQKGVVPFWGVEDYTLFTSEGPVVIIAGADGVTFAPAPAGAAADALTAEQALATFERVDAEFVEAPDMTSQLGLYTSAVGDGTYRFKDRVAWGYSWHACPPPPPIGPGQPTPSLVSSPCVEWLFLDAHTGEMLEGVFQR